MKKKINGMLKSAVAILGAAVMTSCAMESPFGETKSGDGTLQLVTSINGSTVTRAEIDGEQMSTLREKAVIYLERKNNAGSRYDVIRKYFGLDHIPASISLSKGNTYLAEGWTGDSVSASFDSKFYRGKTNDFEIETTTMVALKLNIANVLVSFAPETFDLNLRNLRMTVGHSRGTLTFSEDAAGGSTLEKKGYFMMPSTDTSLEYTITAETEAGESIERTGVIENVERAHEYQVRLRANDNPQLGGGLIRIEIADIPVIEEQYTIYGRPAIEGIEFDLNDQIFSTPGHFNEKLVYVSGYGALSSLVIGGDDAPDIIKNLTNQDLTNNTHAETEEFEHIGIHVNHELKTDAASGDSYDTYTLYFHAGFFDSLHVRDTEYVIEIYAVDRTGKYNRATMRVANTEAAREVFIIESSPAPDPAREPMAISATKATLSGMLYNADAVDYGIQYRKSGDSEWIKVKADNLTRGSRSRNSVRTRATGTSFTCTLTNLIPGTEYEYKTYADDFVEKSAKSFSTESKFDIPNSSFEEWSTYSASTLLGTKTVILPWSVGNKELSFWGSGNEGAATAGKTLTDKSTDMKTSGEYSARLASDAAMGIIAAGNLFVGTYVKTDGTNGVLSLGRPYNGSHPTKVKVMANYRPASGVTVKGGNEDFVPKNFAGGTDHGQIYVALTTEPVEIRTNPDNRKLFDPNDPCVLAYGEKTFTSGYGPDGVLQSVEIPFTYNSRANTRQPAYLVIVVSASKYGDYFSGAKGSIFYLDDFELVY